MSNLTAGYVFLFLKKWIEKLRLKINFKYWRKILIPFSRLPRKKLTKFTGPQGRIDKIRGVITDLLRLERLVI